MSKKASKPAEIIETGNPVVEGQMSNAATQLALIRQQEEGAAGALAVQLGYEGSVSIGALEDGIRFYQRRTVEACLELGKRLLLLKSVTPVGDFTQRVEMLGFSYSSANRFMNAALKTSGSPKLGVLSTQVKSVSAFLELVTHDDDVLEALAEIDDIDRMPASELRKTLRELKANSEATDKLLAAKDKKLNELSRKGQAVGFTDGVHVFSTLIEQIDAAKRQLKASYAEIDICISAALEVEGDEVEREGMNAARIALAQCIKDALDEPERMLQKVGKRFEDTIALLADEAAA